MAFGINFDIKSVFSESGFQEAENSMDRLNEVADQAGLSAEEFNDRMQSLNMTLGESSDQFYKAGEEGSMSFQEGLQEIQSEAGAVAAASEKMGKSQEFVQEQLDRTNMVMHENSEGAKEFRDMTTGSFKASADAGDNMLDMLDTFEFEALSAMFAGMQLSSTMQDLTSPAMESAGVFELISDTLEIFFLPIVLAILPWLNKVLGWFRSAPKPIKMVIGALAILGIAIGKIASFLSIFIMNAGVMTTILGVIKAAFLSAGSLIAGALSTLAGYVAAAISAIVGFISLPVVAIAAVIAAIIGFVYAWKNNLFSIRQKVGKFVQFIGKHFTKIAKIMFLPLEPLNMIIKAINRLTGKSLPTVDDVLGDIGDSVEEMGEGFEESGEKMDKMKKKAPDKKKQGFIDRFMPDIGGKKSEAKGSKSSQGNVQNEFKNKFEIKGTSNMDESELARKVGRRQKEVQDKKVRTR